MASKYTDIQREAVESGLASGGYSFDGDYRLTKNGILVDPSFLEMVEADVIKRIANPKFKIFTNILDYIKWTRRPAPPEDPIGTATEAVLSSLGIEFVDDDASYHRPKAGDESIGSVISYGDLEEMVEDAVNTYNVGKEQGERIFTPHVLTRLKTMIIEANAAKCAAIKIDLSYSANCTLDTWVRELFDFWHIEGDFDVFSTMWKHWMWCVKRRFHQMKAVNEIMINIYGTQGSGKTIPMTSVFNEVFTKKMFSQIAIDTVTDTRNHYLWAAKAVLMLDELQGDVVTNESLGSLKAMITSDTVDYRLLGQNKDISAYKTASMISSSNFHLCKRIKDASGMRRFIEFNIDSNAPKIDEAEWYAKLAHLVSGAKAAFRDININGSEHGYWIPSSGNPALAEVNAKIKAIQDSYVPVNATVQWLKDTFTYDQNLTRETTGLKLGNKNDETSIIGMYWVWYETSYPEDRNGRFASNRDTIAERIVEIFGKDAVFKGNGKETKLRTAGTATKDYTPGPSGISRRIASERVLRAASATPLPVPVNDTPFAEFE